VGESPLNNNCNKTGLPCVSVSLGIHNFCVGWIKGRKVKKEIKSGK
jgi:hypothetical protein